MEQIRLDWKVKSFRWVILSMLVLLSLVASYGMLRAPTHENGIRSVYKLGYLVGPTTFSLVNGRGLLVCTELMGTPGNPICFKSARMPVASLTLATGVELFGDQIRLVAWFKTVIGLLPLWFSMYLVLWTLPDDRKLLLACGALLAIPLSIINYLFLVTSMEVEEGYFFGLIALAFVIILFVRQPGRGYALLCSFLLALVFLSKSSMLPAALVLLLSLLWKLSTWRLRAICFLLFLLAPLSWAVYQHHVSGRASIGTSLDGMNFHKGNNAYFHDLYPSANSYLDSFDWQLNHGHHFSDEWAYNDYHLKEGTRFALEHRKFTLASTARKLDVLLFSIHRYNVTPTSRLSAIIIEGGILTFRFIFWFSILAAMRATWTGRGVGRYAGLTYCLFVALYCLPYLVGFGYIRHAVVLAYPAAAFCCLELKSRAWERFEHLS